MREETGCEYRADLPFRRRTMLAWVLSAMPKGPEPIIVGGNPDAFGRRIAAGSNFVESLSRGLAEVREDRFLLATADLPFLSSESVEDFLSRCDPTALFNYPIVPEEACVRRYGDLTRTTLKLREGRFTGGNIALVHTELMRRSLPIIERAYRLRKSPLRLAGMVGAGTLLRVVIGQVFPWALPVATLEQAVGKVLGGPVRAIISEYGEIGVDIDNVSQYRRLMEIERANG
jgi:hypothetical protein